MLTVLTYDILGTYLICYDTVTSIVLTENEYILNDILIYLSFYSKYDIFIIFGQYTISYFISHQYKSIKFTILLISPKYHDFFVIHFYSKRLSINKAMQRAHYRLLLWI